MLNLDTHILVFALDDHLRAAEKTLLESDEWSVSAIVLWEIVKLEQLGRIDIDIDSAEFRRRIAEIQVWPVDIAVCRAVKRLDFKSDPADEIIAATSLVHGVPLVTRDRNIRKSRVVPFARY